MAYWDVSYTSNVPWVETIRRALYLVRRGTVHRRRLPSVGYVTHGVALKSRRAWKLGSNKTDQSVLNLLSMLSPPPFIVCYANYRLQNNVYYFWYATLKIISFPSPSLSLSLSLSLFYFRLKIFLFGKSFPLQPFSGLTTWFPRLLPLLLSISVFTFSCPHAHAST